MRQTDPDRERTSSLRRSRVARQGLVAGAVAGSLGIAGALGLSAYTQGAAPSGSTNSTPSTGAGTEQGSASQTQQYLLQGDDDGGHELDDDGGGQVWVPAPPSTQFNGGGGGSVATPHAQSAGS